jgi:hypothetical protein
MGNRGVECLQFAVGCLQFEGVNSEFGIKHFQLLLHLSLLGDILGCPDHPDRPVGGTGYGCPTCMDDAGVTIGTDDTVMNIIGCLTKKGLLDSFVNRLPVIGMDQFNEIVK